jgi:hypothetical protein
LGVLFGELPAIARGKEQKKPDGEEKAVEKNA